MNDEDNLKSVIKIFVDKWDNTEGIWNKEFISNLYLTYKGFDLKISFGMGNRVKPPKYPYITFLKYNQKTSKGVYPYISYEENELITGLGVSRDNTPEIDIDIIKEIDEFPFTSFSTNEIDLLINKLNENISEFELIFNKGSKNMPKEENMKIELKTKNIMLYGAPGVGKTHNYKRLITMIESGNYEKTIFDTISKNDDTKDFDDSIFEMIKNEKRIEFITFHQSYSYEDFIEGFRPQDDGTIRLEDGIFKKLCDDAKINLLKSINKKEILFIDAINLLLKDKIENQENIKINLKRENSYFYIYDYNDKTIYFEKQNGDKSHTLSLKTLEKMYYEGTNNIINGGLAPYYNPLLEELLKLKNKFKVEKSELKNFYIVIDEINRGNISKIFGELITLIEEDKRDAYEVTLPYSKEKFKIPSNLYIIATMNSTDKSIATIDIALRRRFTFLKMKPNIDLVPNIAKELFSKLNEFIKESRGEDYQLGHSYFMKIENESDLEFVKEYKIKPLLEEYFYGDDENHKKALDILNGKDNL
ncbi:McrB family protein [Aliarcobacter vitoriensis]|uniref:McrB family protein n=1 Tax=Aliarcobacter vitoriensis TaxID=2011099 RepID=UPI003AB06C89